MDGRYGNGPAIVSFILAWRAGSNIPIGAVGVSRAGYTKLLAGGDVEHENIPGNGYIQYGFAGLLGNRVNDPVGDRTPVREGIIFPPEALPDVSLRVGNSYFAKAVFTQKRTVYQ